MNKLYLLTALLFSCFLTLSLEAQRLEVFSEDPGEFVTQLEELMTASKQQAQEEAYKEFAKSLSGGLLSEEEFSTLHRTTNAMLNQRMSANPYFRLYLEALLLVKKAEDGQNRFQEWSRVLEGMLADEETSNGDFQDFLAFSLDFFGRRALKYSDYGISWMTQTDDYNLRFRESVPSIVFDQLDLVAARKEDSIVIYQTAGVYYPLEQVWRGQGGKVTWERFDPAPEAYAELVDYELEVKKSLYEADNVKLHYPLFFGNQAIVGSFSDKVVSSNTATEGSYPRFESKKQVLQIENIGKGIDFQGGFRLQGLTVYGFGSKDQPARVSIFDKEDELVFRGEAEQFTIRREEQVVAERVESVLYFGQDSIFHPSVNVRFQIPTREMQLSRGERGSDRNPFFNSLHEVNIDVEKINAYFDRDSIVFGQASIATSFKQDVFFESLEYFRKVDYQRFQSISTSNPIAIMAVVAEKENTSFINANRLASYLNSSYTVDNIQSLLYDLVSQGFINYDSDKLEVEIKDKVFHYAKADQHKVDYDVLKIRSETQEANAVLDLNTQELRIGGVPSIEFSANQRVAMQPVQDKVILRADRNIDFDGRIFAGFSMLEGKDFHFDYDRFLVDLDSVRFFDLYVPTGELDENRDPVALSISSRIEHLSGVLLIDAPSNKSGQENIPMFPSLQSKGYSYVFYDKDSTQGGAYQRDSFYFQLDPFSFNQLDNYTAEDVAFKGKLVSADIFPEFQETIQLQEDQSLGFISDTPPEGYPAYTGKGQYTGAITLSNRGLLGLGNLRYLGASVDAEDIIFKPRQMLATADRFDLEENRPEEVPQAHGVNVSIDWRPYRDSMYISSEEAPFALYRQDNHTLDGTLILTPGGLKARGLFEWDKARMRSQLFSFGAFSVAADTTNLEIKTLEESELALETSNVNARVDFDEQRGHFKANRELGETVLPYNQYKTSMNEFTWNMKEELIAFQAEAGKAGQFVSIHPDQDSLRFEGETALYDLKTNLLKVEGVPSIVAADAFVYPDSGKVEIQRGGVMTQLTNARIVADTLNQNHVINRATVDVRGRRFYEATGFYEYNIGDREQEIEFSNIVGQPVGKGRESEKRVVTRARGEVSPEDSFYIDVKTEFQGVISLSAESKNLTFDGFARITADKLPYHYWFSVNSEADKNDLAIAYDQPKSYEGEPLETGLFLSKETARVYPRAMMPLYFRKDRGLLPTKGIFKYNRERDFFVFGDSAKIVGGALTGNIFTFNNRNAEVRGEGKFDLGSGLRYIQVDAAGFATTKFPPPPPPEPEEQPEGEGDIMLPDEGDIMLPEEGTPPPESEEAPAPEEKPAEVDAELMAGVKLILPEPLVKEMVTDFQSATFGSPSITYLTDLDFYKKSTLELFPDDKNIREALNGMSLGLLEIPKKFNPYTFLFSRLKMRWHPDYQSFVTTNKQSGLVSINGETINKMVEAHVEIKMPSNEDDRLYIYLKSPSTYYYFFGFKQGILSIVSNNTKFMDELLNLKNKDLVVKMDDGENYEIQPVEPGTATLFLRRVEAANMD